MSKFYFAALTATLLLASCSGKKDASAGNDTDSAVTAEMEAQAPGLPVYSLTPDSIGPVRVGEKIDKLPQAIPDLYDVVLPTETPDAMAYTYLLADVPQFTIYDFMEGKVDVIVLEGNARCVKTPDGELRVGDDFSKVLALPGVKSEWAGMDDTGVWYWIWNGIYFGVDETNIGEALATALSSSRQAPRAGLFTPDVKIGYIATGLPF